MCFVDGSGKLKTIRPDTGGRARHPGRNLGLDPVGKRSFILYILGLACEPSLRTFIGKIQRYNLFTSILIFSDCGA